MRAMGLPPFRGEVLFCDRQEEEEERLATIIQERCEKRMFKKALARHCETPCATSAPLAWLPLRSYGFRFIIQADWKVPPSREAITASYPKNNIVVYAIKKHLAAQTLVCTALLRGLCVALCFLKLRMIL